jgi:excisionase family DNA binding protein
MSIDINSKNVLTFSEAVKYTGFKSSYLYKLTSSGRIPHYKPIGKLIFFKRLELEEFLTQYK